MHAEQWVAMYDVHYAGLRAILVMDGHRAVVTSRDTVLPVLEVGDTWFDSATQSRMSVSISGPQAEVELHGKPQWVVYVNDHTDPDMTATHELPMSAGLIQVAATAVALLGNLR